ncbi:TetR/AcrR family transcriptional regulator [Promicromonospora thailandica]|uniref:Transcriptional regulator, TetR family n=1 Tax=Promicromonospora thailandica TaxID=765201 RepID=A0A9X2FWU5_9MICO|nr:TetR/AcrR family transcriptional regulator [Promicromonospora thailandica]MCP2262747.1 transcriptional regulator, TetR family [Promicromonospora thailandica]BFF18072.1 TetR family transcriptional regulator [Promicromonospora thailandica]
MTTGRTFTATARRAQIVDATVRVIAREGLSKASFGRIAAEAGLSSPGMISYHFADKDELLTVLGDTLLGDCVATIEHAVGRADGPAEGLRAYLTAFVRWQDTHRDEVDALWRLSAGWKRPGQPAAFDEGLLLEPLLRVLRAGRETGAFRPVRVEWVAQSILCAVEGFQQAFHDDPELDADAFADMLADLFERGIAA